MNTVESAVNIGLAGCVSGAVVFLLTLMLDFLVPVRMVRLDRHQCEKERGKAVVVGALTGIGIHLARHFSS